MQTENSTIIESMVISRITLMSITLLFCFNTLVVLVYFIRRRVRLGLEIRRIPADQLVRQQYKNYFMNLKTTIKITNFIILILIQELLENILLTQAVLTEWGVKLIPEFQTNFLFSMYPYVNSSLHVIRLTYVPLLTLAMDFIWHVYRKYEYKYTMIKWTAYIVIRSLVIIIWMNILKYMNEENLLSVGSLLNIILVYFYTSDFVQYVYYSKRFYSHLKSREKEIRLFYYDKDAYLYHRWIRIHFLVGNILVTNALFLFTLGTSILLIADIMHKIVMMFDRQDYSLVLAASTSLEGELILPIFIVYKTIMNLNYLYIIIVIVYKSIRGRIKLYNINKHIKPIVKMYHDSVYNKY